MFARFFTVSVTSVLISLVAGHGPTESRNAPESNLIIRSLEKALGYLKNKPESVTGDVVLGVLITRANLQWIYNRLKYNFGSNALLEEQLHRMLSQCGHILDGNRYKNYALLKEYLWKGGAEDLRFGFLKEPQDGFLLPDFDSCESIDSYFMRGTPEDSDFCINELITSNCGVSDYCWLSEVNGDSHSGYKTSHRLLYFQVAIKMKCDEINPEKFLGVGEIKIKLCQQMLWEARELFRRSTISMTRDLFMEQIALCGLEGFQEFAPENWRSQVRNWQSHNGCFGGGAQFENCSDDALRRGAKSKRTDSVTEDCHTHVTAVAISALAFFLRVTLNLAFNLP